MLYKSGKSLVALLAATTMLSLTACGSTNAGNAQEAVQDASSEQESSSEVANEEATSDTTSQTSESDEQSQQDNADTAEEEEIPALRDCVEQKMGCRIGCAITGQEPWDIPLWNLVTTHFNAVTLGNELKLDCMLGYNNASSKDVEFEYVD